MDHEAWAKNTAEEREQKYRAAIDTFNDEGASPGTETFGIIQELAFGETCYCEQCDESVPELLIFSTNYDGDVSAEKEAFEGMNIEYNVCSDCIIDWKEEQKPENRRMRLVQRIESYMGMPTTDYDHLIEEAQKELTEIEESMLETCEGCGGEIIPSTIAEVHIPEWGMLSFVPENGLCAMEYHYCGVNE